MFSKSFKGLVVTATIALVLAVAAPSFAQQPAGHGRYDAQILQDVTTKLQSNDKLKDVHASVEDGIVTLTGNVKLYRDKLAADRAAHHIAHAQGVRNEITVAGPQVSDAKLRDEIADRLRYDRVGQGVTFNNFQISVDHGVVTVAGQARTPWDKDSALSIVENTPGVTDVIDNIRVLPVSQFDDELRIRTARAIYSDPALQKYAMDPQAPIRIVVENGKVTLYGVVDSQMDKQIAETRAREVSGSFQVVNKLVVANQGK
jgi:osmotically-inducible protein OsmY